MQGPERSDNLRANAALFGLMGRPPTHAHWRETLRRFHRCFSRQANACPLEGNAPSFPPMLQPSSKRMPTGGKGSVVSTDASAVKQTHAHWRETLRRFHRCFSRQANACPLEGNAPSFPPMLQPPSKRMPTGGKRSVASTDASAVKQTHAHWRETLRRFHRCFSRQANACPLEGNAPSLPPMLQPSSKRMPTGGKRSVVSTDASAVKQTHAHWRETLRRFHRCFSRQANACPLEGNAPSFPPMLQPSSKRMPTGGKRSVVSTDASAVKQTHAHWRETLRRFHRCFSRQANACPLEGNAPSFPPMFQPPSKRMPTGGKRSVVSTDASAAKQTHGNDGAFPSSDT